MTIRTNEVKRLSEEDFYNLITLGPLISIDLIIRNSKNNILLGKRNTAPAKDEWFVPGGRIFKNETIEAAFLRIIEMELGPTISRNLKFENAVFIGPFTHIYEDNFRNPKIPFQDLNSNLNRASTHYVVLAYELMCIDIRDFSLLPVKQHSCYKWWTDVDAMESGEVNINNLPYFRNEIPKVKYLPKHSEVWLSQYDAVNNRRNSFNQLLWQTPSLSLTAQAFLFTTIFSSDVSRSDQLITSIIALTVAFASIHLLYKHREGETAMAKLAHKMEEDGGFEPINGKSASQNSFDKQSAYRLWTLLLALFGFTSLFVILDQVFRYIYVP